MQKTVNKSKFVVSKIKKEADNVITLFLSPKEKNIAYTAGQYVLVSLNKDEDIHGKFYTISSEPSEDLLALSIKKVGSFSSALHNLKINDVIYISGPYGSFYPTPEMNDLVFFAAGIGITPFFSVIKDIIKRKVESRVRLFYTNKTLRDISFFKEINKLASKNPLLEVFYHLTRDTSSHELIKSYKRININQVQEELKDLRNKNYYICGTIGFVADTRKQLLKKKVKEENIFTESFF